MTDNMPGSGFHDVVFPPEIALGSRGGPVRRTEVVALSSGHEARTARWSRSRRRWDAGTGIKCEADIAAVIAFFEAREGRRYAFRWRDPFDHASGTPGEDPSPTDQVIGEGNGTATAFRLVKHYGGARPRTITKPVPGSVIVAVDGAEVLATTDPLTGLVTLDEAPDAGAVVTAGYRFDVPARFDTDALSVRLLPGGGEAPVPVVEVLS